MGRLIDEEDAINALMEEFKRTPTIAIRVKYTIEQLPPAQPERKKGKWIRYDGDWLKTMFKCSECGAMIDVNEKYRNFFCYHCGARME